MSSTDFSALSAGYGDPGVIERLQLARLSKNLLCVRELLDTTPAHTTDLMRVGLRFLAEVQETRPDVAGEVLAHPLVGAWAMRAVRVVRGQAELEAPAETYYGQLAAVAAVAGIRAAVPFDLTVPVRSGRIMLPSLGRVRVGTAAHAVRVVSPDGKQVIVDGRLLPTDLAAEDAGWQPIRVLRVEADGVPLTVQLDDLDEYRLSERFGTADRLAADVVSHWQQHLAGAWSILLRDYPRHAAAIQRGLITVVPLTVSEANRGVSATARDAFGAVLLSQPTDARSLALTLVHEFQHGKLWVLLDLIRLHNEDATARFYAPWRPDPRPLRGLLHGAYAFLGVTDFWRVQRMLPAGGPFADYEFTRWRERLARVFDVLVDSGQLTSAGHEFVAGMRGSADGWATDAVPLEARLLARDAVDDHQTTWRIRNQRPDPTIVEQFVKAWRTKDLPPAGAGDAAVAGCTADLQQGARLDLASLRINEPERFAALLADPAALRAVLPLATAADRAFAGGDYPAAVAGYRTAIETEPGNGEHWAGLTVALGRLGSSPAVTALRQRPDLVVAVYQALSGAGIAPAPDSLADWVASSLAGVATA